MAKATASVELTQRELNAIGLHFDGYPDFRPLVEKIHAAYPDVRLAQRKINRENKAKRVAKNARTQPRVL